VNYKYIIRRGQIKDTDHGPLISKHVDNVCEQIVAYRVVQFIGFAAVQ